MLPKDIKNRFIYSENDLDFINNYFDFKRQKFIHNLDTIYYTASVKESWSYGEECKEFLMYLDNNKYKAMAQVEPLILYMNGYTFQMNGIGFSPYLYDIEVKDKFLMFFIRNKPNDATPEVWVQIRSQYLWLVGEDEAVKDSIDTLKYILNQFDIHIDNIVENRLDFAYHTNFIQNPLSFFPEEQLNAMQVSHFKRASKEYNFVGDWDVECDYVTFGRKKSNNLFFRVYNKGKEVIEKGYKQFFLKIWLLEGLINRFDFYCYEKAFLNRNYNYLDIARLEFYLEYGCNEELKSNCYDLIYADNKDYDKIRKFADKLLPKVNLICNVEIETRRKFYYSMDESCNSLLSLKTKGYDEARSLFIKLDNKQLFHNLLTCNNDDSNGVIRFINRDNNRKSRCSTAHWWTRLQKVKLNCNKDIDYAENLRQYQTNIDLRKIKDRAMKSIATMSLMEENETEDIWGDICYFISTINESDTQRLIEYKKLKKRDVEYKLNREIEKIEKNKSLNS